jgi:excisionase family DNA binding protein
MEQSDKVIRSFEESFDKFLLELKSSDAQKKLKQVLLLMVEILDDIDDDEENQRKAGIEETISVKQAAKEYGISITTLYKEIREGRLAHSRIARNKIRLRRSDIERYKSVQLIGG